MNMVMVNKGLFLTELENYQKSLECYDKVLELDPVYVDAWNNKGKVLYELSRFDEALECYDEVLRLDSNYKLAWDGKAVTLFKLNVLMKL